VVPETCYGNIVGPPAIKLNTVVGTLSGLSSAVYVLLASLSLFSYAWYTTKLQLRYLKVFKCVAYSCKTLQPEL
jgi:hypothetical protein